MKSWTWSAPRTLIGFALQIFTLCAWMVLPWHFSEFRHGLALGLALMSLLEMLRERSIGGVLAASCVALLINWSSPRAPGGIETFSHVLAGLMLLVLAVGVVRHARHRGPGAQAHPA